jgi:hypothetical protein
VRHGSSSSPRRGAGCCLFSSGVFVFSSPCFSFKRALSRPQKNPPYSAFFPCLSHSFPIFSISPSLHAGVESLFIGPRERGLFIVVHGSTAAPRWLVGAAPLIYHHQGAWGFGLLQGTRHTGFNEERRRS